MRGLNHTLKVGSNKMFSRANLFMTVIVTVMLISTPASVFAYRSGPPPGRNGSTASGGASCMVCHGATVGAGSVTIIGAPVTYQANVLYNLTIRIEDSTQAGAGFQLSAEDPSGVHTGVLFVADANTQPNTGWINHTSAGVTNSITNWTSLGNAAEYNVVWQAPASDAGPVTFWAAGNAINNNSFPTGDLIYLTTETADFSPPVPTVSQWGLLVMLLVLMTAGTLLIGRRYISVAKAAS